MSLMGWPQGISICPRADPICTRISSCADGQHLDLRRSQGRRRRGLGELRREGQALRRGRLAAVPEFGEGRRSAEAQLEFIAVANARDLHDLDHEAARGLGELRQPRGAAELRGREGLA